MSNANGTYNLKMSMVVQWSILMQRAKTEDLFIRDIKTLHLSRVQIDNLTILHDFCAPPSGLPSSSGSYRLSCLGDFECTTISYHHLLLTTRWYGTLPIILGPIHMHYTKFASIFSFASSLLYVGIRKSLEGIKVFGTDGETALFGNDHQNHNRTAKITNYIITL